MTPAEFYDQLAPFYHLIYPDWEASMTQQAAALDSILQEYWHAGPGLGSAGLSGNGR